MRTIFLECCKHCIFSPFSERSVAARGVGKFVPNHVNIVCRLSYYSNVSIVFLLSLALKKNLGNSFKEALNHRLFVF